MYVEFISDFKVFHNGKSFRSGLWLLRMRSAKTMPLGAAETEIEHEEEIALSDFGLDNGNTNGSYCLLK